MTHRTPLAQCFGVGMSLAALLAACTSAPSAAPPATADVGATVGAQVQATLAAAQVSVSTQTPVPAIATPTALSQATQSPTATATGALLSEARVADLAKMSLVRVTRGSTVGSGVIVSPDGLIVTNEHVIRDSGPVRVRLADGRDAFADLLVGDREVDLALLRVPLSGLDTVRFADTSRLRAGDALIVAGFALDLPGEPTITRGVFSGRRLLPDAPIEYLQTDAAMNPGVSGGPMLNLAGEVVGINTWGLERAGGRAVQGVNFAIPAEVALSLVETGRASPPQQVSVAAPPQANPSTSASQLPSQFWTVCVWCDSGTHDPREEADKVSAALRAAGLPAGVLSSSDYPSLNPGYWVTFSGIFDGEQAANQHRELLARAGFAGRVRLVSTRAIGPSTAEQPFWTAVVASTRSEGDAQAIAARLRGQGRPGAVLLSSRYSSLNPGYWVAYSGQFTDRAAADQQAQELRTSGYQGAYAREVRP